MLQSEEITEIVKACPPDKFRGLRGPLHVPRDFEQELQRIDSRLVLRWQPHWQRYAVFCRMERTDRLWHQPVHIVQTADGGLRAPDSRDIEAIRKAAYLARKNGARAFIDAMDRQVADQQRSEAERREKLLRRIVAEKARKHDLTYRDIGVTRKAWTDGRRRR